MVHHQYPVGFLALAHDIFDVLLRDIGFRAMNADAHDVDTRLERRGEVIFDGPESWNKEHPEPGLLQLLAGGRDHLLIGMPRQPHLEGRSPEPVAMADDDDVHTGAVNDVAIAPDLFERQLMLDRMGTVAQG